MLVVLVKNVLKGKFKIYLKFVCTKIRPLSWKFQLYHVCFSRPNSFYTRSDSCFSYCQIELPQLKCLAICGISFCWLHCSLHELVPSRHVIYYDLSIKWPNKRAVTNKIQKSIDSDNVHHLKDKFRSISQFCFTGKVCRLESAHLFQLGIF